MFRRWFQHMYNMWVWICDLRKKNGPTNLSYTLVCHIPTWTLYGLTWKTCYLRVPVSTEMKSGFTTEQNGLRRCSFVQSSLSKCLLQVLLLFRKEIISWYLVTHWQSYSRKLWSEILWIYGHFLWEEYLAYFLNKKHKWWNLHSNCRCCYRELCLW